MDTEKDIPAFGFIITRCVRNALHDKYWRESHRCIRLLFPSAPIVIIDDHSDPDFVTEWVPTDQHTDVIPSPLRKGAGEFVPYYYLYTHSPFSKAVIMHDSMFLQEREPLLSVITNDDIDFKFLWYFTRCRHHMKAWQHHLINNLHATERPRLTELLEGTDWYGCFGGCSVISLSYLTKLEHNYGFMNMSLVLTGRRMRMAFERVLALCCIDASDQTFTHMDISIYGNIDHHYTAFRYRYEQYARDKENGKVVEPCTKVWSGR